MISATRLTAASAFLLALCALPIPGQERRERPSRQPQPPQEKPEKEPEATDAEEEVRHLAIVGGDVHVGNGTVMRRATVLVRNDKIEAVGHEIELPEECETIDASGKIVTPGFCIPIAPNIGTSAGGQSAKDNANPFDGDIKLALSVGITSYLWQSGGGKDMPGGHSALVKLSWGDLAGMVAVEDPMVSMRIPLSPQKMRSLRELVEKAREHLKKVDEQKPEENGKPIEPPKGTEEVLAVMERRKKLWIGAGGGFRRGAFGVDQIRQALEIADLFDVGVVLVEPTEGWLLADEIAASDSMAVVAPREKVRPNPGRPKTSGSNQATAAILDRAGVPVAVSVARAGFGAGPYLGTGGILGQDLNTPTLDPAFAIRGGYPARKALRTITLDSARVMGADARVGSVETGKDADLLILDGDPLNYRTLVEVALVNGKVVYEKDKEPFYQQVKR